MGEQRGEGGGSVQGIVEGTLREERLRIEVRIKETAVSPLRFRRSVPEDDIQLSDIFYQILYSN